MAPQTFSAADLAAIRKTAGPATCSVTVTNSWGIPMALTTGWIMGDGKFVVTDLGSVSQKGAAKATLAFSDGATLSAKEFGLADPALGLVLLRVGGTDAPARPGLAMASQAVPPDKVGAVASVAWPWARQLDMAAGRMVRGLSVKDIAARVHVDPPQNMDAFLRIDGAKLDTPGGGPVVDNTCTVVAVRLDLAVHDLSVSLAVPASALRQSLLAAPPELKLLADLPKPLWPVRMLRMKGEPMTAAEFAKMGQALKAAMICPTCKGAKEIDLGRAGPLARLEGRAGPAGPIPCPTCGGEGIKLGTGVYDKLAAWAEQGTRASWSPTIDDRSRTLVRNSVAEILQTMAASGVRFRTALMLAAAGDFFGQGKSAPRGCAFVAQLRDTIDGPDGRYLILGEENLRPTIAIRTDDMTATGKTLADATEDNRPWVMVIGEVLSPYKSDKYQGVAVLPLQWALTSAPGAAGAALPRGMQGAPGATGAPGAGGPPRGARGG